MAFKQAESSSTGNIPFFNEFIKDLSPEFKNFLDGKMMQPKKIKAVESGKGFMLNFDDEFAIFIWKKSSIGSIINRMIDNEEGYLLLIQFKQGKKNLSYDIGFDDEIEVAITEDKFEEGIFYLEETNDKTLPIAPDDFRRSGMGLPIMTKPKPVEFKLAPTKKPKPEQRSDGEGAK